MSSGTSYDVEIGGSDGDEIGGSDGDEIVAPPIASDGDVLLGKGGDEQSQEWCSTKRITYMLNFSEEEKKANGSKFLYSCCISYRNSEGGNDFIVRDVDLEELVSYSTEVTLNLKPIDYHPFPMDDSYIQKMRAKGRYWHPIYCAVHRSGIIFSGEGKLVFSWQRHNNEIQKLPDLPDNSQFPLMVDLGGNLYALSFGSNDTALHVLDHVKEQWSELPQPPHLGSFGPLICSAVVDTKLLLFVQGSFPNSARHLYLEPDLERRVFCFDPAQGRGWRQLPAPSFCFNLHESNYVQSKALVLNVSTMNIMFFFDHKHRRIGVHTLDDDILSDTTHDTTNDDDDEDKELVKLIGYFRLPDFNGFGPPFRGEFIHLGGNKVCFVGTWVYPLKYCPGEDQDSYLLAIPFEFIIGTNDKSFKLEFMPPRISSPFSDDYWVTGSFLL